MNMRLNKLILISLLTLWSVFPKVVLAGSVPPHNLSGQPSPSSPLEIRDFKPQPNKLMIVTYANDRVFVYQIEKIIPRPECNQVKFDKERRIRITTQAISQAYEYVLASKPVMFSEWVDWYE